MHDALCIFALIVSKSSRHPNRRGIRLANPEDDKKTLADLIDVMAALRTPKTGCPWDLKQTFETIAPYTIEEAYEVADAIARANTQDLKDELGDLLLQVVYHARMAEEDGAFQFDDVAETIVRKMIRRHPHVFGSEEERKAGAAPGFWDRIKAEERANNADVTQPDSPQRTLADIPVGMPALTRAIKLQNKAAKVGFDWPSLRPVFDKMREELGELEAAIADEEKSSGDERDGPSPHVQEEFGDLLFVMANVARHLKLDPEAALRGANHKFTTRFEYIEDRLHTSGRTPSQSSLEEMDALWDEAKTTRT